MDHRTLPKSVADEVREYLTHLAREGVPVERAIVFGSYAKGTPHEWSDIDLCVVSPRFTDWFDALQYLWRSRLKDTGLTIEPIGMTPEDLAEDTSLTAEIKKHGIEIPLSV